VGAVKRSAQSSVRSENTAQMTVRATLLALILPSLLPAQTLQLNPGENLLRNNAAAASAQPIKPAAISVGYLYIEPYQARFEAMFDATTVLRWLDPKAEVPTTLTPEVQKSLTDTLATQAAAWCALSTPAGSLHGSLTGVEVIKGQPGATLPLEPGESLPTSAALVGLMWDFPTPPAPDEITVEWSGFIQGITRLPIRVFFATGPYGTESIEASSEIPRAKWRNQGRVPKPAPLARVPELVAPAPIPLPIACILWLAGGIAFYTFLRVKDHRLPGGCLPFFFAWLLGLLLTWPLLVVNVPLPADVPEITTNAQADAIVTPVLRNVYRAFDHRAESEIYDVLARSVEGELLRKLYLETIQALTLEGREGTRVTINEFSAEIFSVKKDPQGRGFITDCQWTALGKVWHWGHEHSRVNRYTAKVTFSPVSTAWKMTALEVSEAVRR